MTGKQGFALIELVIVVAVVGILAAIGAASVPRDRMAVRQAAEGLTRDAQYARFQAITRNTYVQLNVDPATDAYEIVERDSGVVVKRVSLGGDSRTPLVDITGVDVDANDLVFDPRGVGIGLGPQVVTFESTRSDFTRTVAMSQQGRAQIP